MGVIARKVLSVLFRNDVGTRNRSLRVQLEGRVSNRSAVGSTIQIRAGSLGARTETSATTPRMQIERYLRIGRRDQRELALAHIGRAVEVYVARRKHSSRRRPRCTGGRVPLRRASGHIVPPRAAVAESAWSVGGARQQIERPVVVVVDELRGAGGARRGRRGGDREAAAAVADGEQSWRVCTPEEEIRKVVL